MNLPKYPVIVSDDLHVFEFFSEGPRGHIKKGVFYTRIGSTAARTRLYQISIGFHLEEISEDFDIQGLLARRGRRFAGVGTIRHS